MTMMKSAFMDYFKLLRKVEVKTNIGYTSQFTTCFSHSSASYPHSVSVKKLRSSTVPALCAPCHSVQIEILT